MPEQPDFPDVPQAVAVPRRRWSVQLIWLIPLVAVLVGGWLAVRAVLSQGPNVTIRFKTAEGLEPGKTRIKYKDVEIGIVKTVSLADDRAGIVVEASLSKSAGELLVTDTRFWVVRARIIGGTVSGIGTLLSGSYIGMDPGKSTESRRDFEGLETPPVITTGLQGKEFTLRTDDIGSLDVGSPIYYRRLQAGRVAAYDLDKEGKSVLLRVFIDAPFDQYVNANTRFWHASGIDVSVDASGFKLNTESVASVLVGGLAFQTPEESNGLPAAAANTLFQVYDDRAQAMKQPITNPETYMLVFNESVRGLAVGAPVDLRGLTVGEVKAVNFIFDSPGKDFPLAVAINVFPDRLRGPNESTRGLVLGPLVERGLRAQLRSANLLTGQLFVALDFFPAERKARLDYSSKPPRVPTLAGTPQELQTTIASIAKKIDKIPFEQIGGDLRKTLNSASTLMLRLDKEIVPEARETLTGAREAITEARKTLNSADRAISAAEPLPVEASDALREIARAAQSFRTLADYLERHPEALIRGKKEDPR